MGKGIIERLTALDYSIIIAYLVILIIIGYRAIFSKKSPPIWVLTGQIRGQKAKAGFNQCLQWVCDGWRIAKVRGTLRCAAGIVRR